MNQLTVEQLCGWAPHPEEVTRVLGKLPAPFMFQAAPHLVDSWDGKTDICLWEATLKVLGSHYPAHKQTIGDCVSHGHGGGLDYLQCVQIALGKFQGEFVLGRDEAYTEAIYGQMRKRANQLSNQDGACGIWAVDSLIADGYPQRRSRAYNGQDAKKWGAQGPPSDIIAEGSSFKLAQYIQVKQTKEAADLLSNGYPITVCSNQGFSMTRDSNGVCQAQGSWGHCMLCIGAVLISGSLHFTILQSWGQNVPSGPTIKNQPNNSFHIQESIFQRMLNAADSYALTSVPGFPAQELDFFV